MTRANIVEQIREGMKVESSDGWHLGKVARVWFGDAETYVEVLIEPTWKAFLMAGVDESAALYIPSNAIGQVSKKALGSRVTLTIDAERARTMTQRPKGMETEKGRDTRGPWSGGM